MFEIHGAQFRNKGAHLMLLAVQERLSRNMPEAELCMEHHTRDARYPDRARHGLYQPYPAIDPTRVRKYPYLHMLASAAGKVIPRRFCDAFGLVRRQDVDGLINVSGYNFGDGFTWMLTRRAAIHAASFRKRSKPVVFLPQMLGPFKKENQADWFGKLFDSTDVFYARDRMSLEAARAVVGNDSRLKLAPDLTIFVEPNANPAPSDEPYGLIVPNIRMLDQGKSSWGEIYLDRLTAVGRRMADAGVRPRVLVHDTDGPDSDLGDQLGNILSCEVVTDRNPKNLKGIVSDARLLVGSRFHAIVASLSTGVPAIAMGWAHKYEMILEDFGTPDLIHQAEAGEDSLIAQVDELIDSDRNQSRRETLKSHKETMRASHEKMWEEVLELISKS